MNNPLHDDPGDSQTFRTIEILRMYATTREYGDDLQRAIVRAMVTHPHCKAHDNGLTGRMTFLSSPVPTEALVNVWLGDAATSVRSVRTALDALIGANALVETRNVLLTRLDIVPCALPIDRRDSEPYWGINDVLGREAA